MAAFDEARFGAERTLNLRDGLPSVREAVERAERWLRERQVRGGDEVLIITGRGNQSIGGTPVIKPAIEKLLYSLRRRGVIAAHRAHNPGAFVVTLAPVRALIDAPRRKRERPKQSTSGGELHGLDAATRQLLRDLSERSLNSIGVVPDERNLSDEMQRHLRALVPALPSGPKMEERLRVALSRAIADYD
jgi:hypothetical protein